MKLIIILAAAAALALPTQAAWSQMRPAAGTELFYSADSDDTQVLRGAIDFDLRAVGEERYAGIRLERARYDPAGTGWQSRDRLFLRAGDETGAWQWRGRIGTDGDTVIGALSINDQAPVRKELFIERDIVETPQGLARGIYSTFAGAAFDLPADERNVFTALAGVQAFTGDNVRIHLRGSYIHVVKPQWGLSAQLRGRWFRSSDPGEFDYYSPRWYAEILPVAQLRRFVGGWEMVGAAGLGVQRDSGSDWRQARYAHARFRSPAQGQWRAHGAFTYTNTPSVTAAVDEGYRYVQFTLGISRSF